MKICIVSEGSGEAELERERDTMLSAWESSGRNLVVVGFVVVLRVWLLPTFVGLCLLWDREFELCEDRRFVFSKCEVRWRDRVTRFVVRYLLRFTRVATMGSIMKNLGF
jgi:hypothetical protein